MDDRKLTDSNPIDEAVKLTGAIQAEIPGLWYVRGYPELTTMQLLQVARDRFGQNA